jgi:hypothetical protein
MSNPQGGAPGPIQPAADTIAGEANRQAGGRVGPQNTLAMRHGGRRQRALTEQQARDTELYRQWAADLGGLDTLSTAQREVLAGTVASALIRQTAERYLASARLSLSSAKAQTALATFFKADDAVRRGAALLGLQRKAREVPDLAAVLSGDE